MIIVIFLVCIGLICLGYWLYDRCHMEATGGVILGVGVCGAIISTIAIICLAIEASSFTVIDAKIEMYQDENTKIESQIAECIEQYQQYETDIFTEVAPESSVTLVALYPELKSDTLVSKQIDIYLENNKIIKKLKETKINGDVVRWWLYFGAPTKKGGAER
jgi:hypothetical protein